MKNKIKKIHFVGIGGSGMSGIAEVMHTLGFTVTGSDKTESTSVKYLKKIGIKIFNKHSASNIKGVNVLEDQKIREEIKIFSDWPTIPQLYIKKEFVGGCDIVKEMYENGELKKIFEEKGISFKK